MVDKGMEVLFCPLIMPPLCRTITLLISLQRLTGHLHSQGSPPYVINLDPAVHEVPFPANIGK